MKSSLALNFLRAEVEALNVAIEALQMVAEIRPRSVRLPVEKKRRRADNDTTEERIIAAEPRSASSRLNLLEC
jgi:hypothetical protein